MYGFILNRPRVGDPSQGLLCSSQRVQECWPNLQRRRTRLRSCCQPSFAALFPCNTRRTRVRWALAAVARGGKCLRYWPSCSRCVRDLLSSGSCRVPLGCSELLGRSSQHSHAACDESAWSLPPEFSFAREHAVLLRSPVCCWTCELPRRRPQRMFMERVWGVIHSVSWFSCLFVVPLLSWCLGPREYGDDPEEERVQR